MVWHFSEMVMYQHACYHLVCVILHFISYNNHRFVPCSHLMMLATSDYFSPYISFHNEYVIGTSCVGIFAVSMRWENGIEIKLKKTLVQ